MQKLKITSCAFILCLFGLTLMTVSLAFAVDDDGFTVCDNMPEAAEKLSCFRDLARSLRAAVEEATNASRSQEAVVDQAVIQSADAEGAKVALKLQIEEINGWLKDKDKTIEDLQSQLSTARSESQAKDATITELQGQLTAAQSHQEDVDAENALLHARVRTISTENGELTKAVETLTAEKEELQVAVAKAEAQIADLQGQLTAAQSGSQDAAQAAEKVELLLAFIDKQGSGDTSTIHIHKNYGHGGKEVRKNWNKCRNCKISYDEIQALKDRLKD